LRVEKLAVANFLTALAATFVFKVALFRYAASGAEGVTSALLTWPRIPLCLGWDVLSAAIVAAIVTLVAAPLLSRLSGLAIAWSMAAQAIYAAFLLVSYHIALIVGAPLDKAAIDLLFLYNATPGRRGTPMTDSVAPYLTPAFWIEAIVVVVLAPALFVWLRRRHDLDAFVEALRSLGPVLGAAMPHVAGSVNELPDEPDAR